MNTFGIAILTFAIYLGFAACFLEFQNSKLLLKKHDFVGL